MLASLLLAMSAVFLASLDHHAAEYDPYHEHMVLTARGPIWTDALPPHAHGGQARHDHGLIVPSVAREVDSMPTAVRTVSVGGLTLLAISSTVLATSPSNFMAMLPGPPGCLAVERATPATGTRQSPTDPPPRIG
jgi:hypothetical protein